MPISEFFVRVIRLGKIGKHPYADNLSITNIYNYPVILQTGSFKEGDLAVYIPVDSVVPENDKFAFLQGKTRIKAKKIRNIFSMGLLVSADPSWEEGRDVMGELGITKYEAPLTGGSIKSGRQERDPGFMPEYGLHAMRKFMHLVKEGDEVVLTEKLHGSSYRACWHQNRLWVGSHTRVVEDGPNTWWDLARQYDLENKLQGIPGIVIYGEMFGSVQTLKYGAKPGEYMFNIFDAFVIQEGKYLNYDDLVSLSKKLDIPMVPELYRGPWKKDLLELANGKTTFPGADHIKEGFVLKLIKDRWDLEVGRVILKHHGEEYLLSKYS